MGGRRDGPLDDPGAAHFKAAYFSGLNPTSKVLPRSSTGRLIIDGCSSMSFTALGSVRLALAPSGSLRKVVPARFSSTSQPAERTQDSSFARPMPDFL